MLDVLSSNGEKGCNFVWFLLIFLLLVYILWDVNYFLRIGFTVGCALFSSKRIKPDETTEIYGKILVYYVSLIIFD